MGTEEKEDHGETEANTFRDEIREAIEHHYEEFPRGDIYYLMREIFDEEVSGKALRKIGKRKLASRELGIHYGTFRKMRKGK